jgi:hypothetical protein
MRTSAKDVRTHVTLTLGSVQSYQFLLERDAYDASKRLQSTCSDQTGNHAYATQRGNCTYNQLVSAYTPQKWKASRAYSSLVYPLRSATKRLGGFE